MLLYQKTNKKIKEWMSKTKVNSSIVPKLVLLEHKKPTLPLRIKIDELNLK